MTFLLSVPCYKPQPQGANLRSKLCSALSNRKSPLRGKDPNVKTLSFPLQCGGGGGGGGGGSVTPSTLFLSKLPEILKADYQYIMQIHSPLTDKQILIKLVEEE